MLKTIIDRVELRPNGLQMILSLVPLTPAAAPPNRLQGCVFTREFPLRIKRRGVQGSQASPPLPCRLGYRSRNAAHGCGARLRPADDTGVLRRRGFAEAQARGVAVGLCNGKRETRRIETVFRELSGAVFARRQHAPMATLGSGNAPSSLARRLAAGHADKDAHDADEWRKWRRDHILAASETVGVG